VCSMREFQLVSDAISPLHREEARTWFVVGISPATARPIEQVVADKSILRCVSLRFWQLVIAESLNRSTAIGEARNGHCHQSQITGSCFGRPHAVASAIRADQHI